MLVVILPIVLVLLVKKIGFAEELSADRQDPLTVRQLHCERDVYEEADKLHTLTIRAQKSSDEFYHHLDALLNTTLENYWSAHEELTHLESYRSAHGGPTHLYQSFHTPSDYNYFLVSNTAIHKFQGIGTQFRDGLSKSLNMATDLCNMYSKDVMNSSRVLDSYCKGAAPPCKNGARVFSELKFACIPAPSPKDVAAKALVWKRMIDSLNRKADEFTGIWDLMQETQEKNNLQVRWAMNTIETWISMLEGMRGSMLQKDGAQHQ